MLHIWLKKIKIELSLWIKPLHHVLAGLKTHFCQLMYNVKWQYLWLNAAHISIKSTCPTEHTDISNHVSKFISITASQIVEFLSMLISAQTASMFTSEHDTWHNISWSRWFPFKEIVFAVQFLYARPWQFLGFPIVALLGWWYTTFRYKLMASVMLFFIFVSWDIEGHRQLVCREGCSKFALLRSLN